MPSEKNHKDPTHIVQKKLKYSSKWYKKINFIQKESKNILATDLNKISEIFESQIK